MGVLCGKCGRKDRGQGRDRTVHQAHERGLYVLQHELRMRCGDVLLLQVLDLFFVDHDASYGIIAP